MRNSLRTPFMAMGIYKNVILGPEKYDSFACMEFVIELNCNFLYLCMYVCKRWHLVYCIGFLYECT